MLMYTIRQEGPKTVALFTGDLDIEATEVIEEDLTPRLIECNAVEIDFSEVPFVDSSGIGLLIALISHVKESGSTIVIKNICEDVQMVFSLLQLPEILGYNVFADITAEG